MGKIYHNFFNRPSAHPEKLKKGSKVETAGYIPLERRIRDMVACGLRLKSVRAEMFDIPPESDLNDEEVNLDPTRRPGFDLADASALADELKARYRASGAKKKVSGDAKKDDQGEGKPSKGASDVESVAKGEGSGSGDGKEPAPKV